MTGIFDCVSNDRFVSINSRIRGFVLRTSFACMALSGIPAHAGIVSGSAIKWHPMEIRFSGGTELCETSAPSTDGLANPFLSRRLNVKLTHFDALGAPTHSLLIPGFFDGDGKNGNCGNTWVVRFTPDMPGTWKYTASFRRGSNVNLSLDPNAGTPIDFDGDTDSFTVAPRDPNAPGFLGVGRLEYVGAHYLKHADGGYFIKGGTDSPENLFGADAFDDTFDQPGGNSKSGLVNGLHRYTAHRGDFGPSGLGTSSDPLWTSNIGGDSRGVIGLLNYLASRYVNSVYILPMNLGGDGRETYPFVGPSGSSYDNTHYDLSKLRQWNMALNHAQRLGIMWNCVLSETESGNEKWYGSNINELSDERKLFYRELVARFSYLNGVKWNLGEESDYSIPALNDFADYISALDPYGHTVTFHTNALPSDGSYSDYENVLGDPRYSATSLQHAPADAGNHVEKWRADSAASGRKWVVDSDEQLNGLSDSNGSIRRKQALYDVYFSGGNIEWYFGDFPLPAGGDLNAEDMRTRENMWDYMWFARKFMIENLPFALMEPADSLHSGGNTFQGGAEVFAWIGNTYAIYLPNALQSGQISLPLGDYNLRWYSPRTGEFEGSMSSLIGGGKRSLGSAPSNPAQDWVVLIERDLSANEMSFAPFLPEVPDMVNTSALAGATPGGPILMFFSTEGTGTFPIPGCGGVTYNLIDVKYSFTVFANLNGKRQISLFVKSGPPPGAQVFMQAMDPLGCAVSNVTTFTW